MLSLIKVISTDLDDAGKRIIKFLRFGRKDDIQTALQAAPHGIDSNPVKDLIAIYAPTNEKGETVIIGYLNKNQLAEIGEIRTYSTDENGEIKFYTWLKNDGTMELGGNSKNLTRFQELESGFNQLRDDHNDLVNAFNTHMHPTAGSGPPSIPTPGTGIPAQPSTASIEDAKIEEIKSL